MKKSYMLIAIAITAFTAALHAMDKAGLDNLLAQKNINWDSVFKALHPKTTGIKTVNAYTTNRGDTLLFVAVHKRNHSAAEKLLKKYSADPNIPNRNGVTPLMVACQNKDIDMVKLLIAHDANPKIQNNQGEDCLDYINPYSYPPVGHPAYQHLVDFYTEQRDFHKNIQIYNLIKDKL